MNWEQAYREECRKLEDVRNELKEREEHICEMQLLIDKANEKLKVHFSDVVSSWVSVKDRLPEIKHKFPDTGSGLEGYSDNVLVWCNDRLMVLCLNEGWMEDENMNRVWGYCWSNCDGNIDCYDPEWDDDYMPTHWMPLPEKPNV